MAVTDDTAVPPRRRGRPPLVENQRERILERAAVLFGTHGFQGVGVAALAEDLGMSKAALFHYFRSKQDIYDWIVLDVLRGLSDTVHAAVSEDEAPPAQLLAFMRAHARFFEENYWKFVVMLVGFGGITPPRVAEVVEIRDEYEARLRRIVADGMADGSFRRVDVATTGRAVLSMLNWMARWYKPGGAQHAEEIAESYAELLLSGLDARPAGRG
jgi:TetR/AcrR family transcriptional regulator, cholesterol catabolism regulator